MLRNDGSDWNELNSQSKEKEVRRFFMERKNIMRADQKIFYREWEIIPFSIPMTDGKWSTNCEIEKIDADGLDVFQGALGVFVGNQEAESIIAACDDAKRQIDAIIADPLG